MEHVFATIPPSLVETARRITAPLFANWTWELTTAPLGATRQVDALGVVDRMSGAAGTFWQAVIDQELDEELYDADDLTAFYAGVTVVVWETELERNADIHAEILDHYGYVFTPPEPDEASVKGATNQLLEAIVAGYSRQERETWYVQLEEAKLVKAGATNAPMLESLANARGLTLDAMADRVMEKYVAHATAAGALLAEQARLTTGTIPYNWQDRLNAVLAG